MSSVTNSSSAISNAAAWVSTAAKTCGNAVLAGASKVAQAATAVFRASVQYATSACVFAKDTSLAGWNLAKANPGISLSGLALGVILGAAVYAYNRQDSVG